jgi:hypothetical protein
MPACAGSAELDQALSQVHDAITELRSQLSVMVAQATTIVEGLMAELAAIEAALEEEAYLASRYGVRIGTDGQPPPEVGGPLADASTRHWARAYREAYERAIADGQLAKYRAAAELMALCEQPDRPGASLTGRTG